MWISHIGCALVSSDLDMDLDPSIPYLKVDDNISYLNCYAAPFGISIHLCKL
jgi:hypothetical protein